MKTERPHAPTTEKAAALSDPDAPTRPVAQPPRLESALEKSRKRLRAFLNSHGLPRVLRGRSARAALFAFALSRVIVLVIFVLVGLMRTAPDDTYSGYIETHISVKRAPVARVLRQEVLTADVNWYLGIVERGYEPGPFRAIFLVVFGLMTAMFTAHFTPALS